MSGHSTVPSHCGSPSVMSAAAIRLAYVELHSDERGATCAACLQRAGAWFAERSPASLYTPGHAFRFT